MTKIFIATLLAFTATPVLAEPPVLATAKVEVADLDLRTLAGQRALDRRISHAVIEVCGTASDADVEGKNDVRRCRSETLARLADDRNERIAAVTNQPIEIAAR